MEIDSVLAPERAFSSIQASSKKKAIEVAAERIAIALPELSTGDVYRGLIEREKLGSTGLGDGVAIPHCRLDTCTRITGSLFTLEDGVDFSSPDDEPVKIMFVLIVPASETTEHLATLAMLAERFSQPQYRELLIKADGNEALYHQAIGPIDAMNQDSSRQ